MKNFAKIIDIAGHLPKNTLTNSALGELYKGWSANKILEKTGISNRHIAGPEETAGDLAYEAAQTLFAQGKTNKADVDFLIFCTQAPDYILPTTACILQNRLQLSTSIGAVDINLGCSGYVYSLSLAKGLIESGAARFVLILTADTYSKYINPLDKSVRTIFGDGASATIVQGVESTKPLIGPFIFGTDGSGANNLIVPGGLFRLPSSGKTSQIMEDESGNARSADDLYMNGAEVMSFSLREVPKAINNLLEKSGLSKESIDFFVLHQANRFMLQALSKKMKLKEDRLPILMENCGNTVSSSIPLAMLTMQNRGDFQAEKQLMLVGFGVGYSWAACLLTY